MPDVLIRDVPAEDLARIDALAARLKISRTEYLRRRLHQEATIFLCYGPLLQPLVLPRV